VSREALEEWPVFRHLRTNEKLINVIKQYFPSINDPVEKDSELSMEEQP
jgi:hypothetical protein